MALSQLLVEQNFPAIAIHKAMTQDERSVVEFAIIPVRLPRVVLL